MKPGPEADGLRHKAGAREKARTRDGRRLGRREGRRGSTRRSLATQVECVIARDAQRRTT